MIVETSGLADPAPILQTLMSDPLRLSRYRFARLTATVDGVLGAETLQRYDEASRQVAIADGIFLTKTDLADEAQLAAAHAAVQTLSAASIASGVSGHDAGAALFSASAENIDPGEFNVHHAHGAYFSVTRSLGRRLPGHGSRPGLARSSTNAGLTCSASRPFSPSKARRHRWCSMQCSMSSIVPNGCAAWPDGVAQGRIVMIGQGSDPGHFDRLLADLLDGIQ